MRAMILAAGLGTRLRPLSLVRPKVLTPIGGLSILDFWVRRLHHAGFEAVVINAHHLQEQLVAAVHGKAWPIPVQVQVEPVLLGTGGGVANVLSFFQGEPFLVINGDILCDVPLPDLFRRFLDSGASAGLLMHDCQEFNNVAVDAQGFILGFGREAGDLVKASPHRRSLAFTGIHVIHPEVVDRFPPGQPGDILTVYRRMILAGSPPLALNMPGFFWRETGSLESYRRLHQELVCLEENAVPPLPTGKRILIHPAAEVSADSHLMGYVSIGAGSRVMRGSELENTILWDDVEVRAGSRLRNCVVADGAVVSGEHDNEILTGLNR
jgi:mannose-1-phosphate guanylyltransferase